MPTDSPQQWILPFQRERNEQVEAAAILALAELDRIKGGGFINKKAEEKLLFLIKGGYPLWLCSRNGKTYLFDGLNNSSCAICYPKALPIQALDCQVKGAVLESFEEYLSELNEQLQGHQSERFLLKGLIDKPELRNEFTIYHPEADKIDSKLTLQCALFAPALTKKVIDNLFLELDFLQLALKQETEKLSDCIKVVKQIADQHKIELDFSLTATIEEANAKIQACEELINPQVDRINRKYKRKIASVASSYNKKIKELESKRIKAQKSVDRAEEKISDYKIETDRQAYNGHYYERRWAKKFARLERELNSYTRNLEALDSRIERITNSKETEIGRLNSELYLLTESLKRPLYQAQIEKGDRIDAVEEKIQRLIDLESKSVDCISKTVTKWDLERSLHAHSLQGISLPSPALVYVPFYLICYQSSENKRIIIIPPSTFNQINFSDKLKGVFGFTNIKKLLNSRFQIITTLVENVQDLLTSDTDFVRQLSTYSNSHNLLMNSKFRQNAKEGLEELYQEGWLSKQKNE